MKWLIYLLLLSNLAFFAWRYHEVRQTTSGPDVARQTQALPSLMLLSEVQRAAPLEPAQQAEKAAGADQPRDRVAPSTVAGRNENRAPVVEAPAGENQGGLGKPSGGRTPTVPLASSEPAVARVSGVCFRAGPVPSEKVDEVLPGLKALGGVVHVVWKKSREPRSYWVYLPPFPTIAAARAMLKRLKDDKVRDFIRVMNGPDRNAVSLGLYSRKATAEKRVRQLREKGYDPKLGIRYKELRQAVLEVSFTGPAPVKPVELQAVTPGLTWVEATCASD